MRNMCILRSTPAREKWNKVDFHIYAPVNGKIHSKNRFETHHPLAFGGVYKLSQYERMYRDTVRKKISNEERSILEGTTVVRT